MRQRQRMQSFGRQSVADMTCRATEAVAHTVARCGGLQCAAAAVRAYSGGLTHASPYGYSQPRKGTEKVRVIATKGTEKGTDNRNQERVRKMRITSTASSSVRGVLTIRETDLKRSRVRCFRSDS